MYKKKYVDSKIISKLICRIVYIIGRKQFVAICVGLLWIRNCVRRLKIGGIYILMRENY